MRCPFPGMDPWLEEPALWPGIHNRLIGAIADDLANHIAPKYSVTTDARVYRLERHDSVLIGIPDAAWIAHEPEAPPYTPESSSRGDSGASILDVAIPSEVEFHELKECFAIIREVQTREVVTVLELLSPGNKQHTVGRAEYLRKRNSYFESSVNLIEIDLLRSGEPMPLASKPPESDYRVLISRGHERPAAKLFVFSVRDPIPALPIPLKREDPDVVLDLNDALHRLYDRGRFDLLLLYGSDPRPPLAKIDAAWARERLVEWKHDAREPA